MKSSVILAMTTIALAAPAPGGKDPYANVDWDKVDYSNVDYSKVDWSKVDYGNGGYKDEHKDYNKKGGMYSDYWKFTSKYHVVATPDQVVDMNNTATGGQPGAIGYYDLGINSEKNFICYSIRICNLGDATYESPADTATHIHEAARGKAGPPRIAFPNPAYEGVPGERVSMGCLKGPFQTGVLDDNDVDTGKGFHVSEIEKNPHGFMADIHTNVAVPGAVRGQIGE